MKWFKILVCVLIFLILNNVQASINPAQFIVMRMDYQSYDFKYLYYFTQRYDVTLPDSNETTYHDLYVRIVPATDFGETTIRSRYSGEIIYQATTVWNGTGEHIFPPSPNLNLATKNVSTSIALKFLDFEEYFFQQGDWPRAQTAWDLAVKNAPLRLFGDGYFGALVYLHYFSVGVADPTAAEWIVIFYRVSNELPDGVWKNIGMNLPNQSINDAHVHFAFEDTMYAATPSGIFKTYDDGQQWEATAFSENKAVNVTVVEAVPNPWVDCLCEYIYVGTEEYTMIPEERKGRILRSPLDGMQWEDTEFPDTAVTAIGINPLNPNYAYASAYNPFYNAWGLFKLTGESGWVQLLPTNEDTQTVRINCIEVHPADTSLVFAGTDQGLKISRDCGKNWTDCLGNFNISSVQFFRDQIYASTDGNTRSDGIYVSRDYGETWDIYTYWLFCQELATAYRFYSPKPGYFFLADTIEGVFASRESPHSWQNISETLPEKNITCLEFNRSHPMSIVAGTERGLYKYESVTTAVECSKIQTPSIPSSAKLLINYPNPFNATTQIRYKIEILSTKVKLLIYNSLGQQVRNLVNKAQSSGEYRVEWDGRDDSGVALPTGIYFCVLETSRGRQNSIKLIYLK